MTKLKSLLYLAVPMVLAGCAGSPTLLKTTGAGVRHDVFQEVVKSEAVPRGFADLRITGTLKTHKPGLYTASDVHGTAAYQLQLTVDGQSTSVPATLEAEDLNPKDLDHPEAGEGIRYRFGKTVRLKPGGHQIVAALPGEGIAVAKEITLVEGEVNILEMEPIYGRVSEKKRPSANKTTSFEDGISGLRLSLNGRDI